MLLLDRRICPDEDAIKAEKEIMAVINREWSRNPELDLTVESGMLHGNFLGSADFRYLRALKEAYRDVRGYAPFVGGSAGALDACYSVHEGIPTVTFGAAGAESNSHGSNESVRVKDLVTYAQIVSLSLFEYLGM